MALPTELDFVLNDEATPARMNEAMEYIASKIRALEAATPEFEAAINQLKAVGLERLTEALAPIFLDAQALADALTAIEAAWVDNNLVGEIADGVLTTVRAGVVAEFDTLDKMADALIAYRSKYLGAKAVAPTLDDNGLPVAAGASYFDTVLNRSRVFNGTLWVDAGSVVQGIMTRQSATAAGGEMSIAVPGGYDPGNIIVAVDGLTMSPAAVVTTSGTAIGFTVALTTGQVVTWTKFAAVTPVNVYTKAEIDEMVDELTALALS